MEGVVMGTRCGSIDPSVVSLLEREEGLSREEVDALLNKKSGLLGISGLSNDVRDLLAAAGARDERAQLALAVHNHSVVKTIGGYVAAMGGVDAITFTAGIGENCPAVRAAVLAKLGYLGAELDAAANEVAEGESVISKPHSSVALLVVPTDEELHIARETLRCAGAARGGKAWAVGK